MPPEDRFALRDILVLVSSMTPVGGQNPGLRSASHIFWLYSDRIVRYELGGGPVPPIEYGDDEYAMLSTVLSASGSTTATVAELLSDGRLQQVGRLLAEISERRRRLEEETQAKPGGEQDKRRLRSIVLDRPQLAE